jgi:hypothetical protein
MGVETGWRIWRNTHVKRRISSLVAGTVLMLVAGACGAESRPWLVRHYLGLPPRVTFAGVPSALRDDVVWTAAGRMAVMTLGSSSCPVLPVRLDVPASNRLTVTVQASSSGPCTADLAATTSVIKVPAALDVTDDVTVTINDDRYGVTVSLPPRAGAGN